MFVFDALPSARNPVVVETARADDFSPVKNAEGVDSPATCRGRPGARSFPAGVGWAWPGRRVPAQIALEVSPLFGYDEDSFMESWSRLNPKPPVADGLVLGPPPAA